MPQEPTNGILEEFRLEFLECWKQVPNKGFFLVLLAAWLALFQFLGNSARGYIDTPSLMGWMWSVYTTHGTDGVSEDSHGSLMPVVVLALFWWKRKELLAAELRLWWPGLALVGLGLLIHTVGFVVEQSRISIVGLFIGIYGLTGLAWGPGWLRRSFFPFFLFAFCVPLGSVMQPITFPLRMLVSRLVEFISNPLLGIGIIRNGTDLIDPGGQYKYGVAAPCSGIHSLIATLVVALIYALLRFRAWWRVGLMVGSAVPLAVAGNVLRMLTIVLAAEAGGQSWGNYIHEGGPGGVLSLLPYVPVFGGLLLLGHWLKEPSMEAKPEPVSARPLETQTT
jgi:exosortase